MSHGSTWSDAPNCCLEEADIQECLDGATRNQTIFVNIAKKYKESGETGKNAMLNKEPESRVQKKK